MQVIPFPGNMQGTIKLQRLFIFLWLLACIALSFLDLGFVSETMGSDSDNIMQLAQQENGGLADSAYANTALFFSYIPTALIQPFILVIGCIVLILLMKGLREVKDLLVAAFISIPAILFILIRPQKETIVALLSIAVLRIFASNFSMLKKIVLSLIIYGLYAYCFRQYYFIIMLIFIGLLSFIYANELGKLALLCLIPVLLMLIPGHIFVELQGARDVVNQFRINSGDAGSRTAFMNLFYPDNPLAFIGNYFYAFLRLNFSPIFCFGMREFFLLCVISCYGYFIYRGIKIRSQKTVLCSCLLLAHAMVYWVFEPDLGSYLRHISSVMLYLVPMLAMPSRRVGA